MFDNTVANNIIDRIKTSFAIDKDDLKEIYDIIEEEVTPITLIANKKTQILSFNKDDFHLVQFPIELSMNDSVTISLKKLSHDINRDCEYKKNFIYGYRNGKIDVTQLDKNKVYIIKIPVESMSRTQIDNALKYYNREVGDKINEKGYNVTFIPSP